MEDMFEQLRAEIPCDLVTSMAVATAGRMDHGLMIEGWT
jgi:hypothetical protein